MITIKKASNGNNVSEILFHEDCNAYQIRINNLVEYVESKEEAEKLFNKVVEKFNLKIDFTVEKLSVQDSKWYGSSEQCFIVRFNNGFAPIKKFAALKNGRYVSNPETGYISGNGCLGTGSMLLKDVFVLSML